MATRRNRRFSGLLGAAVAGVVAAVCACAVLYFISQAPEEVRPLPAIVVAKREPLQPPKPVEQPPAPQPAPETSGIDWDRLMIPIEEIVPRLLDDAEMIDIDSIGAQPEIKMVATVVSNAFPTEKDFSMGQMMRVDVRQRIAGAQTNALRDRNWGEYLVFAENGIAAAMKQAAMQTRTHRFDPIMKSDLLATLLDQSALIRRVGASTLNSLCEDDTSRAFVGWLMTNRPAIEDMMLSMNPAVDSRGTLERWAQLWARDDAKLKGKYHSLALACAIDFAQPVKFTGDGMSSQTGEADMGKRYAYYRDLAEKHALKTDIEQMPAWQLCWVVNAPVPDTELDWARFHVSHSQREMGKAYGEPPYRMDKISKGNTIYKEYTLEQIRKEGGICGDRAHYGVCAARAHGIPAMVIGGDGDLGAHAWMGYMASSKDWVFDAGRIGANYANGGTTDPQTGKHIGEKELKILGDPERRSDKWLASYQHAWLADVFASRSKDLAAKAYEIALDLSSRNLDVFKTYVAFLKAAETPATVMQTAIRQMRVAFRDYPDQIKVANELEADLAMKLAGAEEAAEIIHRQTRRMEDKFEDRTDIYLENIDREVAALKQAGATNDIEKLYRKALWDHSDSVVLFRDLVKRYSDYAKQKDDLKDAIWYIGNRFRQAHPRPHPSSYFEAQVYAGLMDMMADLYAQVDEQDRADRMKKDANRMREIAAQQTKHR